MVDDIHRLYIEIDNNKSQIDYDNDRSTTTKQNTKKQRKRQ